jgi:hypothetical protein
MGSTIAEVDLHHSRLADPSAILVDRYHGVPDEMGLGRNDISGSDHVEPTAGHHLPLTAINNAPQLVAYGRPMMGRSPAAADMNPGWARIQGGAVGDPVGFPVGDLVSNGVSSAVDHPAGHAEHFEIAVLIGHGVGCRRTVPLIRDLLGPGRHGNGQWADGQGETGDGQTGAPTAGDTPQGSPETVVSLG